MNVFIKLEGGESVPYEIALDDCEGYITEEVKRDMLKTLEVDLYISLNEYNKNSNFLNEYIDVEEEYSISPDNILIYDETYTFIPSRKLSAFVKLRHFKDKTTLEAWKLKVIAYGHNGCINDLDEEQIEFLIEEGCEVYFDNYKDGNILDIINVKTLDKLKLYMKYGGKIDTRKEFVYLDGEWCDLFTFCLSYFSNVRNSIELFEILRPYFDINRITQGGKTYLMHAAIFGDIEIVKYIVNDKDFVLLNHRHDTIICDDDIGQSTYHCKGLFASDMTMSDNIKDYLEEKMIENPGVSNAEVQCDLI